MAEIEVEAKTVEEAIQEGLKKLGCSRDNVEIKILSEGTSGLFGLMGAKPARVLLTSKGGAARPPVDYAAAEQETKKALDVILKHMNIGDASVTTRVDNDRVIADIKSGESSLLIGKGGQTLEALEYITNLIVNRNENTRTKIVLDTENYRGRQEERLVTMAKKAAEQVRSSGRIYRFDPMPPSERRVIHLALKEDPSVETFSEGEGPFRKVGVKPKE